VASIAGLAVAISAGLWLAQRADVAPAGGPPVIGRAPAPPLAPSRSVGVEAPPPRDATNDGVGAPTEPSPPPRGGSGRNTNQSAMETAVEHALEDRDPSWSAAMEARILGQLAQSPGLAVSSVEADCRQTICRLRLIHPIGGRARPAQLNTLLETLGFLPRLDSTFGEVDGLPVTTVYLHRKHSAPRQ